MLPNIKRKKRKGITSFQVIILSFFVLIMLGTCLLMLPISSNSHTVTPFVDALFTATSATCVTGLIVQDTATYWSLFGQIVIISLIQIGGMGVITIGMAVMRASGMKIGLSHRSTMQDSIAAPHVGGMVRLTGFILKTTVLIELIGALLLFPVFCKDFGILKGIWYSLFHSISAFCNAGFDLMGTREQFSSLTSYGSNIYLNIIIMLLIISGGIGFLVWGDIKTNKFRFKRYSLQTKIVLLTSLVLIVLPAAFNTTTGPAHWDKLMQVRAMDSQVYFAACAPAQVEDGIFKAYGNSCIADPWSEFIAHADEKECVLYGDIDLDYVDKIRGQLPLLKHRRPEIYREENK